MATANDTFHRKKQLQNASKTHVILDVMELDLSDKIDIVLQDFLLLCHEIQPQENSVIVITKEQVELHKQLSIQRLQNKIEMEAYQHKQEMKRLAARLS